MNMSSQFMNIDDIFNNLNNKYGDEFTWRQISLSESTGYFVSELMKELGNDNAIFKQTVSCLARNDANDDVLYHLYDDNKNEIYRIYHLTYSSNNSIGYPKYEEFTDIKSLNDFIEKQFVDEFL